MIKVLFVIDQLLRGGAERLLLDMLPRLPEYGVSPLLCVLGKDVRMVEEFRSARIDPILLMLGKWHPGAVNKLCDIIVENEVDLVNAHLGKSIIAGCSAASRMKVPFVVHDHVGFVWPHLGGNVLKRTQDALMCFLTERCMAKADRVISVSEPGRDWLLARHPSWPKSKVETISNGIDLNRFAHFRHSIEKSRLDVRQEFGLPLDAKIILYAASFRHVKGWKTFVDVADKVCSSNDHVYFIGAGTGPLYDDIKSLAANNVRILLPGSRTDVPRLMAASDIFLMPSLMESDGIVVKEAMAMGLPVIANNLPVLEGKIVDMKSGLLINQGNSAEDVKACEKLINSPELCVSLGQNAQIIASENFGIDACVEKTQSVYRDVLIGGG